MIKSIWGKRRRMLKLRYCERCREHTMASKAYEHSRIWYCINKGCENLLIMSKGRYLGKECVEC